MRRPEDYIPDQCGLLFFYTSLSGFARRPYDEDLAAVVAPPRTGRGMPHTDATVAAVCR